MAIGGPKSSWKPDTYATTPFPGLGVARVGSRGTACSTQCTPLTGGLLTGCVVRKGSSHVLLASTRLRLQLQGGPGTGSPSDGSDAGAPGPEAPACRHLSAQPDSGLAGMGSCWRTGHQASRTPCPQDRLILLTPLPVTLSPQE